MTKNLGLDPAINEIGQARQEQNNPDYSAQQRYQCRPRISAGTVVCSGRALIYNPGELSSIRV